MSEPAPGLRTRAVVAAGGGLITALMRTTRFETRGREHYDSWWGAGKPVVFVLWHGRLLPCSYYHHHEGLATLISRHRDGDYISGVVEGWGYRAIRGSSSRGGTAALRQLVRVVKGGTAVAVTPDGPRGPRQRMKPGPLLLAQLTGVPLLPLSAGTDRGWWFEGWDRFLVPKPLSRIRLAYGEPVFVPRDAGETELEAIGKEVGERLDRLTALVDDAERFRDA